VRWAALRAVTEPGDPPELHRALEDPCEAIRVHAAAGLAERGIGVGEALLTAALSTPALDREPVEGVRVHAILGLQRLADLQTLAVLVAAAEDADRAVSSRAQSALLSITRCCPRDGWTRWWRDHAREYPEQLAPGVEPTPEWRARTAAEFAARLPELLRGLADLVEQGDAQAPDTLVRFGPIAAAEIARRALSPEIAVRGSPEAARRQRLLDVLGRCEPYASSLSNERIARVLREARGLDRAWVLNAVASGRNWNGEDRCALRDEAVVDALRLCLLTDPDPPVGAEIVRIVANDVTSDHAHPELLWLAADHSPHAGVRELAAARRLSRP
jgi:hypothetical protein